MLSFNLHDSFILCFKCKHIAIQGHRVYNIRDLMTLTKKIQLNVIKN